MTGLVERLRQTRRVGFTASARDDEDAGPTELPINPDGPEAAARIEELEAALERAIWIIEDAEKDTAWCSGDPYSDEGPVKDFRALLAKAQENHP